MNEELISIVVPIYNVEKYLKECIDSIINQTYKNLEIILVDDGSPDNCGKICDGYRKQDQRIKVIHKKNGGLSDARNAGIDIAKGKYIAFVDSDDYVEKNYIKFMYEELKEHDVKIVQCGINKVSENGKIIEEYSYSQSQFMNSKTAITEYDMHPTECIVAWNKLYDIELFKNIRYPVGKIHEDEFTTYKILYSTEKIYIISQKLYNYRDTENSIMNKKFSIKRLDYVEALKERVEFFKENNEEYLYRITFIVYLNAIIRNYRLVKMEIQDTDKQEELHRLFREEYKKLSWKTTIKNKIKYEMFYYFRNGYTALWILLKRKN